MKKTMREAVLRAAGRRLRSFREAAAVKELVAEVADVEWFGGSMDLGKIHEPSTMIRIDTDEARAVKGIVLDREYFLPVRCAVGADGSQTWPSAEIFKSQLADYLVRKLNNTQLNAWAEAAKKEAEEEAENERDRDNG